MQAGGSSSFAIKATNPSSKPLPGVRQDFTIFPGDGATQNVDASQVRLSYSNTGPDGTFTPVHLRGSTIKVGAIEGFVGPPQGVTLAPHSITTYTFDVALASNVPVSKSKPLLGFESYLDQINPADGTAATLADTYEYQVKVPSEASSHDTRNLLIGVGAGLLVVLSVLGLMLWQRRHEPPQAPPAAPATP